VDLIKTLLPRQVQVIRLTTDDGVELAGYYARAAGSRRLTIIVHGLGRSHLAMADRWSAVYPDLGSVLFLDLRGHGRSSRRALVTFGDSEELDVKAAVDRFRAEYQTIVIWGHSMGAAAALKYAGSGGKVEGLILEGMYHSFDDAIDTRAELWRAPKVAVIPMVRFFFRHVMRIDFDKLVMPRAHPAGAKPGRRKSAHGLLRKASVRAGRQGPGRGFRPRRARQHLPREPRGICERGQGVYRLHRGMSGALYFSSRRLPAPARFDRLLMTYDAKETNGRVP